MDEVVYQEVNPGEPEQKGRCCLNGVGVGAVSTAVVEMVLSPGDSLIDSGVVGPLALGGLKLDVSGGSRNEKLVHTLTHDQLATAV